ncbi:MAG: DUF29 family protein [Acidithiobacillus ferrooxidans]|nr:DUF29 family protein [Acidithiobacillus ferrooxidans]MDD5378486.1 DUF29 family protein [Acidithiobacillus sp.]
MLNRFMLKSALRVLIMQLLKMYVDSRFDTPETIATIQAARRKIHDLQEMLPELRSDTPALVSAIWNDAITDFLLEYDDSISLDMNRCPWSLEQILSNWLPRWSIVQRVIGVRDMNGTDGDYPEDEQVLRNLLASDPRHAQAWCNLAVMYMGRQRNAEAERLFKQSLAIDPNYPEGLLNYAVLLENLERRDEAEKALRRAVEIRPDYYKAFTNLGYVLNQLERYEEAEVMLRRALEINPDYTVALLNISLPLHKRKDFAESERFLRRAMNIDPHYEEAALNLFVCLYGLEKHVEAEAFLRQFITDNPGSSEAMSKLGIFLFHQDRPAESEVWLRRAYEVSGGAPEAAFDLSSYLLLYGHYQEGFALYESRFDVRSNNNVRRFSEAQWDGSPLDGKRILIYTEQGFGDLFQCVRYIPLIKARGGRVILEARPEVLRLFQQVDGADEVFVRGEPYPAHDTYCPIMSLPHVMGTRLDTVPGRVPYLRVPEELQESWRQRLAQIGGLRVGIVWAGNPLHKNDESRSLPLAALAPLAEIPGVSLLSLQKGHGERQLQEVSFAVTPFGDQVQDFADSGAILQQLDVLISVDTSVAHLAGALGVNTYLLLPNSPDWRWLLDRDDTPWYPDMRLFRQTRAGVWDDVLASVAESVRSLSAARR